jgi:hypothetical protein
MKTLITNYTFDSSAKTITFNDYSSIELSKVLLITNTTDNIIIYNFASPAKGGAISTNVLTLAYDSSSMQDSDSLQIYYDDQKDILFYAKAITADDTITPTLGKRIKITKAQIMQNPDNSTSTRVTLNFVSKGDFLTGWAFSDKSDVVGEVNETLSIDLTGSAPVSVNIKYKEI